MRQNQRNHPRLTRTRTHSIQSEPDRRAGGGPGDVAGKADPPVPGFPLRHAPGRSLVARGSPHSRVRRPLQSGPMTSCISIYIVCVGVVGRGAGRVCLGMDSFRVVAVVVVV